MMPHLNSLLKNLFKKEPSQAIKMTGWLIIKKLGLITLLLTNQPVLAEKTSVTQAKKQLQQLESKINNLQRLLTHTKDKQGELNKELSATEKEIGSNIKQLRASQAALKNKQQQVILLQEEVNHLNNQLDKQQQFLAKHIRARYMMGEYQPLKWLVNQTNPSTTNRILTYYQYLIQSDQGLIKDVRQTQKNLANSQEKLHLEINKLQTLQQQLEHNQQKLIHNKRYSTSIISILNKEIQNKQQQLGDYQQNKQSLSRLLLSLTQKSMTQNQQPFMYAMKKLPPPLPTSKSHSQKMNQGLIFFAHEGTPVSAVSSGKIVFSDWLKGYGLLLIIDHGRGFMTLYAHNESLFKQKGDQVKQGEQIATVGHTGGIKENGLYFEIRQRGKVIPPLRWLS